jgi:hypothetical protein
VECSDLEVVKRLSAGGSCSLAPEGWPDGVSIRVRYKRIILISLQTRPVLAAWWSRGRGLLKRCAASGILAGMAYLQPRNPPNAIDMTTGEKLEVLAPLTSHTMVCRTADRRLRAVSSHRLAGLTEAPSSVDARSSDRPETSRPPRERGRAGSRELKTSITPDARASRRRLILP